MENVEGYHGNRKNTRVPGCGYRNKNVGRLKGDKARGFTHKTLFFNRPKNKEMIRV
jgi:hypothetical protein